MRKLSQYATILIILSVIFRYTGFDLKHSTLHFLGMKFGLQDIFILVFFSFIALFIIIGTSLRRGRMFCSWVCPVHLYLEIIRKGKKKRRKAMIVILGTIFSLAAAQACISFILPYSYQIMLYKNNSFPQAIVLIFFAITCIASGVFVFYRDNFCKKACPYAVFQNIIRDKNTDIMYFDEPSGNCINCHRCDKVCPYNLDVRKESDGMYCTNCGICSDECVKVLGEQKAVLYLTKQTWIEEEQEEKRKETEK